MYIAILSDTHDNLPNLFLALDYVKKQGIKTLIHCGDVCNIETLEILAKNFSGALYLSCGNGDFFKDFKSVSQLYPSLHIFPNAGEMEFEEKLFGFCHFPHEAESLAKKSRYDAVFYGHSHFPWEKKMGNTLLLNPGNLANMHHKATFALVDIKTLERRLILLEILAAGKI